MRKNTKSPSRPPTGTRRVAVSAAAAVALGAAFALPLYVDPTGLDPFRLPKLALLRTAGLLTGWLLLVALLRGEIETRALLNWTTRTNRILIAIFSITVASAVFSSLPAASWKAVVSVFAAIALFMAARAAIDSSRVEKLMLWPGVITALLAIVGRFSSWSPWMISSASLLEGQEAERLSRSALLGNSNDVGCFLAFWSVVVLGSRNLNLVVRALAGGLLLGGVLASGALTSVLATLAGVTALTFSARVPKAALRPVLAGVIVITAIASVIYGVQKLSVATGDSYVLERATTFRWGAWMTAAAIGLKHPLLGVGPGALGVHFAPERSALSQVDLGVFSLAPPAGFFGEIHSDFLEVFAETGVPGLTIMAAAVVLVFRRPRARPVAVTFTVLALAFFPLQLAAFVGPAAVWLGSVWREDERT